MVIDGEEKTETLFSMVKSTLPAVSNSIIAFHDNSSVSVHALIFQLICYLLFIGFLLVCTFVNRFANSFSRLHVFTYVCIYLFIYSFIFSILLIFWSTLLTSLFHRIISSLNINL